MFSRYGGSLRCALVCSIAAMAAASAPARAQVSLASGSPISWPATGSGPWSSQISVAAPTKNPALVVYLDTANADPTGITVALDGVPLVPLGYMGYIGVGTSTGAHTLTVSGVSSTDVLRGVVSALFNGVNQSSPAGLMQQWSWSCSTGMGVMQCAAKNSNDYPVSFPPGGLAVAVADSPGPWDCAGLDGFGALTFMKPWTTDIQHGHFWLFSAAPGPAALAQGRDTTAVVGVGFWQKPACSTMVFQGAHFGLQPGPGLPAIVQGRVIRTDSSPSPVTVTLGPYGPTPVDAQGKYSFDNVDPAGSYTMTFQSDRYAFAPASIDVAGLQTASTRTLPDVTATPAAASSSRVSRAPAAAWTHLANPKLKGRMGALVIRVPAGTGNTPIRIRPSGGSAQGTTLLGSGQRTLAPGRYDVVVGGATIPGVEIAPGQDTLLKIGALRVEVDNSTTYEVLDESNKVVAKAYGRALIALPEGAYQVRIGGALRAVTITDGATSTL